ncbi:MAG: MBL fold metallo-hydrolase [Anaerolineales bacterium]|nr:MBL fold metallo-hydrolase [Anaerolineales bacterium]
MFPLNGGWALFDTVHYSDRHLLLAALAHARVRPEEISDVVLSHLHFDHVLNLPIFRNAAVYIAQAELDYADRVSAGQLEDHSIPDFWPLLLKNRQIQVVDDVMDLSSSVRLMWMPGHTPGCLAMFYKATSTVAVCGDVIKNVWEALTGKEEMALGGSNLAWSSIEALLVRADVIVPGHDRPFIRRDKGVEFLTPFTWEVRTNLYPEGQDKSVLNLNFPAGVEG